MHSAKMRLRLYVPIIRERGVEQYVKIECAVGARAFGAVPACSGGKNFFGVCRQGAVRSSNQEVRVKGEHSAIDEM